MEEAKRQLAKEGKEAHEALLKRSPKSTFGAGVFKTLTDAEIQDRERKAEEQRRLGKMIDARQCRHLPRATARPACRT